jgi:hypothetical protein
MFRTPLSLLMKKIWNSTVMACCKFEEIILEILFMKETQINLYSPFIIIILKGNEMYGISLNKILENLDFIVQCE